MNDKEKELFDTWYKSQEFITGAKEIWSAGYRTGLEQQATINEFVEAFAKWDRCWPLRSASVIIPEWVLDAYERIKSNKK